MIERRAAVLSKSAMPNQTATCRPGISTLTPSIVLIAAEFSLQAERQIKHENSYIKLDFSCLNGLVNVYENNCTPN
jgi:hypothetical protein